MTDEKVVETTSLPTIDRGTGSRTKMSRKRFLAFMMAGLMIVAAVSMIAPSLFGNNDQNNGNDQSATISWNPAGNREAIYKIDHLFENYMKAVNFSKAAHGGADQVNHPAKEVFLGHHSMTVMGVNQWLNDSLANSPRQTKYSEMTLRNNYPYLFYWNPNPTGGSAPTLPCGLETWAPYRLTATVNNDTAFKTGINDKLGNGRNVPFVPYWNRVGAHESSGGYINMSLYGTYMTETELGTNSLGLRGGLHYGNWFYGMPSGITPAGTGNDGYFFELHGTYKFSHQALITFLGMPAATADARVWFSNSVGVGGMPAGSSTLTAAWRTWLWENFSQSGSTYSGGPNVWNDTVYNDNIYTNYEFDMQASLGLYVSMRLDPTAANGTTVNTLAIRVYTMGWGPDAALIRMLEKANITGSVLSLKSGGSWINGYYKVRAPMINYGEDVYFNSSITPTKASSYLREVNTYAMIGWEDSSTSVWSGGYQIPLGSQSDYICTIAGMNTYVSPFDKYVLGGDIDQASGDQTKSYDWRGAGSVLFGVNATVTLVTPQVRNLTAYEAIIVDLNVLDGANHSAVAKWQTKFGGQTLGMVPHVGTSMQTTTGKNTELNGLLYWGTVKLGRGSYPTTAILAGYNAATKILNLSGGTTGMVMPLVYNTDYWGGDSVQNLVYTKSMPSIQLDVSAVNHYDIQLPAGPIIAGVDYSVKVTPHNASTTAYPGGAVPMTQGGALVVNETVYMSTNNPGTTWPNIVVGHTNGTTLRFTTANAQNWTVVHFGTAKTNTYVNATGQWFNYTVMAGRTQATLGSTQVPVVIPEFATVLIPIVGMMAMFFIFRNRKKKRGE